MIKQWTVNFDLRETIQYEQRIINNVKMKISYEISSRHICSDAYHYILEQVLALKKIISQLNRYSYMYYISRRQWSEFVSVLRHVLKHTVCHQTTSHVHLRYLSYYSFIYL